MENTILQLKRLWWSLNWHPVEYKSLNDDVERKVKINDVIKGEIGAAQDSLILTKFPLQAIEDYFWTFSSPINSSNFTSSRLEKPHKKIRFSNYWRSFKESFAFHPNLAKVRLHNLPSSKNIKNRRERVKKSRASEKSMFGKQNKMLRRKYRNNLRWSKKKNPQPPRRDRALIEAWRISRLLVSSLHTPHCNRLMEIVSTLFWSVFTVFPLFIATNTCAIVKALVVFVRACERRALLLPAREQTLTITFHRKRKTLFARNEETFVWKTPTLETKIPINSSVGMRSCLVKVHPSLWSFHIQVSFCLLWRLVPSQFRASEWIRHIIEDLLRRTLLVIDFDFDWLWIKTERDSWI